MILAFNAALKRAKIQIFTGDLSESFNALFISRIFFESSSEQFKIRFDIVNIPLHIFLKIFEMFCIGINPHSATIHGDLFQYARRAYAICDRAA